MSIFESEQQARQAVVDTQRELVSAGLTSGASGNVSTRWQDIMLVTPTGVSANALSTDAIVAMELDGRVLPDQLIPSSEWRMHADVYAAKPNVHAVVHCHSAYATILACAHKTIPAQHYMIAALGCSEVPLAAYETFGTAALSKAAVRALDSSKACLLANHGQLATGATLEEALKLAALVEELAHWHWGALAIGGPVVLNQQQMDEVFHAFEHYGQQDK